MFTKESLRAIRPRIEEQLKHLEAELGIKIRVGNASFSANNATFKLELTSINEDGSVVPREEAQFLEFCAAVGLKREDLGKVIAYAGNAYKITGLNLRSAKYPIMVKRVTDGKGFRLSKEAVASDTGDVPSLLSAPTVG